MTDRTHAPDDRNDARVTTVTAEVKSMMVGSRQVTLSVYSQLDYISPQLILPMGRVRPKDAERGYVYVVGKDAGSRQLARARTPASSENIRVLVLNRSRVSRLKSQAQAREADAEKCREKAAQAEREAAGKLHGMEYMPSCSADAKDGKAADAEIRAASAASDLERLESLADAARARYEAARFRAEASELLEGARNERQAAEDCLFDAASIRRELDEAAEADAAEIRRLTKLAADWSALPLIVLAGLR